MNDLHTGGEIKIVFTGPMGAGKTTAIAAISEAAPVSTDVQNADHSVTSKDTTTVALDFGQLRLDDGQLLRLYGTPGQRRFQFMWQILGEGALGVIVLLDASQITVLADLDTCLDAFDGLARRQQMLVGVGRTQDPGAVAVTDIQQRLRLRGLVLPVFSVDVRKRADVLLLLETLLNQIEVAAMGHAA